jgi:hypothetical protein
MDSLWGADDTARLLIRMLILFVFVGAVTRSYVRRYHGREHVFTYWAFAIVTFSIAFLLRKVPMELGFALGLFAVFGVLRYRTDPIGIKDLTYLFVVIGLSLINALANKKISFVELVIVNSAITGTIWVMESHRLARRERSVLVVYDKIQLLSSDKHDELLQDLKERTGLPVTRCDIQEVDLLRDTVSIMTHFSTGKS